MILKTIQSHLVLLLTALTLLGCETASTLNQAPVNKNPIPEIATELPAYRIQVGDVLGIKLLLNPELEEQVTVRPDGKIATAVAQNIIAYGKTPEELQAELNEHYAQHLTEPNLAVIIESFAPTRFYVMGEVNRPGEYISVGPNLTLLQAIAMAGDIKNSADVKDIIILRRGASDQPKAFRADYKTATSGLLPQNDVRLAAYDVVFVPKTPIAEAYVMYEQTIQQFIRPSLNFGLGYDLNDDSN